MSIIRAITIFDFDDTIYPTTFLKKIIEMNDDSQFKYIEKIAITSYRLISKALELTDKVYIITNANQPHIQDCLNLLDFCLPGYISLFNKLTLITPWHFTPIDIVSNYAFADWKKFTFSKALQDIGRNIFISGRDPDISSVDTLTIMSYGDMPHDRIASLFLRKFFPKVIVKNFLIPPIIVFEDLFCIQKYLVNIFEKIKGYYNHLDLLVYVLDSNIKSSSSCVSLASAPTGLTTAPLPNLSDFVTVGLRLHPVDEVMLDVILMEDKACMSSPILSPPFSNDFRSSVIPDPPPTSSLTSSSAPTSSESSEAGVEVEIGDGIEVEV